MISFVSAFVESIDSLFISSINSFANWLRVEARFLFAVNLSITLAIKLTKNKIVGKM